MEPRQKSPRRRVPIDWHGLEVALTWHSDESEYFLNLQTGEVQLCRLDRFGNEQVEYELSEDDVETGLDDGTLVCVEALSSSVQYDWMAEFAAGVKNPHLRDLLDVALRGRGAFRRFKDVIGAYPREREQWFAFHDQRVREAMLDWLADHDIEPTTSPSEPIR